MAMLEAALSDALSGQGRMVMLAGEPGIGKTRIAQELASHAQQKGAQVLWGWCYEREGAPPYWPWVQPIQSYVLDTVPDQLLAEMGPGAADIDELIPEIREKLPDLESPPALEPQQTRFRLFNSISTFLKNLAHSQPLVLVLDDLHWADTPSLLLLEFLARQMADSRILVIGAYRDIEVSSQHPLSESLARLSRSPAFQRLALAGLTSEDVGPYVRAAGGENASLELINAIQAHTEGNPLFISEVIRLLRDQESLGATGGANAPVLGLPQGVLEVIGQRLNRLSEECLGVLTTAAVVGRQFDFNLLGILSEETSEFRLLELVEKALETHILQELPGQGDRYQFSHALVQQTLLERLSTSRKLRLHARIGETLETLYEDQPGDHAAELAYHFTEALPVTGPGKLVKYSGLAGERALEGYAHEEALGHFRNGLVAKWVDLEGSIPAPDDESAALLYGLGRAQAATSGNSTSNMREGIINLKRTFEYYRQSGQKERALQVAQYPMRISVGAQSDLIDLVGPAVEMAPSDSPDAARLLSVYGRVLGLEEGRYDEGQEAFDRALVIAEHTGDVSLEMGALANSANVHFFHARQQEALQTSLRAIVLSHQMDDPKTEVAARYVAVVALRRTGNLQDAARHASAMRDLSEKIRDHFWLYQANWASEMVCATMGDWQGARNFSDGGMAISPRAPTLLSTRVILEYELGQFDEGSQFLVRLLDTADTFPNWPIYWHAAVAHVVPYIALITGVPYRFDIAEKAAETVVSSPKAIPHFSLTAQTGLALMAVMQGDRPACERWYALFLSVEHYLFYPLVRGRLLGLLAQGASDLDKAVEHFEDALVFCRTLGVRPELAWTCHDWAEALLLRDRSGDHQKAKSMLEEALAISTELGMRPLMGRVAALQERAEAQPVRAPAYPDGLSQREVEVLLLIAGGKNNREIAAELFISPNTAGHHVSNILNKTGSANRAELATYANRQGLVS